MALGSPARARRHASAFEVHCGRPRPATASRTTVFLATALDDGAAATPPRLQVGAGVGVDCHADGHLDDARCFPGHDVSPRSWTQDGVWDSKGGVLRATCATAR